MTGSRFNDDKDELQERIRSQFQDRGYFTVVIQKLDLKVIDPLASTGPRLSNGYCRKHSGSRDIRVTRVSPHNLGPYAFAQRRAGMHGADAQKMPLSWIEQCADLGESCLPTFAAGKLILGCVSTTSATDLPRFSSTGVAR